MTTRTILLLAANPHEQTRLRVGEESRKIRNGLRGAKNRDQFRLEVVMSTRQEDMRRAVLDLKPYIVHFCGHGTPKAELVFERDNGKSHAVGADALSLFFEIFRDHLRCVVLNACYTEPLAKAIGRFVNYVVGMKKEIEDDLAIQYAVAFYDSLGAGLSIEKAHQLGCNAIEFSGLPGSLMPVLYAAEGAFYSCGRPALSQTPPHRADDQTSQTESKVTIHNVGGGITDNTIAGGDIIVSSKK